MNGDATTSPFLSMLELITAESLGLLLPSETDAPFAPVSMQQAPTAEFLREASGLPQDARYEVLSLEEFFRDLERCAESSSPEEQAEAERFRNLHTTFRTRLQGAQVHRVGQVQVDVWLLGQDREGHWVGLRSRVTET
jgi:hypothetical protein